MKNFYKLKFNLVSILAFVAGLLMQQKIYSQTTLAAGDILFTGYNSIPAPVDNADIISFVLLRDISNNTVINFTDRGYFGNNTWQAVTSTEGTIRWTSGSFLPMGTEVQITALSAQARIPGGSLTSNGTVVKTEHFNSTYNNASTGMLLASTGDQIIAFQTNNGDTSPSSPNAVFIAGLHYTQCGSGGVNTNDNWDTAACFDSPTKSMMPPGLVNGFSAFKTTIPGGTTNNYSGLFQCTGAPYANAAAIRSAVMNRNNWLFSNDGAGLAQPSGCQFIATCQAPSVTAHPGNRTICSGSNTTFSITATGTSLTYQWQVNTGSGYNNISNTGFYSGTTTATLTVSGANATINGAVYRCVVTGTCGNATSNGATLTVTTLNLSTSKTDVSCNGGNTGSAQVSVSGGSGFYNYSWSPSGGSGSTATNLTAGVYTVTVTDSNGCQNTANVTITQPSALTTSTSQTNIACNGGNTGTISVVPAGGTPGYTYLWSHGPTTPSVTGLSVGNYSVTITDSKGCQIQRNFTLTQPTLLTATQSQSNVSCNGGSNGTASVSPAGGVPGYTYSWSHGPTTQTVTGLSVGSYTVTITDANNCQIQKNFIITQPPTLTASTSQTNIACNGGSTGQASVSPSGGTPGYTYLWSHGPTTQTVTGLSAGSYTVTITDANTCQIQRTFTISEPSEIAISATSITNAGCGESNSGEITVAASGGEGSYTYSWSPSGGTAATASGLAPGTYTVTVTDANNCTASESFEITGSTNPDIDIDPTATICETQGSVVLSPDSAALYIEGFTGVFASANWVNEPSANSNGSITFNPDGTSVQMVSSDGLSAYGYNQIRITLPISGTLSFNWAYSTNDTGTQYDYPRFIKNGIEDNFQGFGIAFSQSGTHSVAVNAGDVIIIRMVSQDSFGGAATVNITNFVVTNGISYDYQWTASEGGVINGDGNGLVLAVDTPGVYTLTATNDQGCTTTKTVTVSLIPNTPPTAQMYQPIPEGETWTLADLTVSGTNLTWYTDETLTTSVPDTTEVVAEATYYVTQTANECESSAIAIVTDCEKPVLTLEETASFCEGNNLTLTPAVSELANYTYLWTASEGGIINAAADEATLLVDTAGTYTLTVTTEEGCSSVHTVVVTEIHTDMPEGYALQILNEGQTLEDVVVSGTDLTWYSDEELTTEIPSTTVFVSETTYYVTQTTNGCESQALAITLYDASLAGNCGSFTVWNGTSWSHGTPDITKRMVIIGNLTLTTDVVACEVLVKSGILTVPSDITLTVNGEIHNMQEANNFIVESGANLLQIDDVVNIGDVKVKRNVWIKHLDYTIWSSPVAEQDLQEFSPQTLPNRIRVYNGTPAVNTWVITTGDFEAGKGYMFRAPNVFDDGNYPNAYTWTGNFIGVANNGSIDTEFASVGKYQSLGNPYPSNLDRQTFHGENINVGALYFWTNTFAADANGNYAGNNWKVVNTLGEAVATDVPSMNPIHIISVGQGFLARVYNDAPEANFNNNMRTSQSGIFYRANDVESHKYWLNLSNSNNTLNQILVSYNAASTNELDFGIDAEQHNYTGSALYSLIGNSNEKYAIQGRALPFNAQDIVPLGFNATVAGSYTISLANFEGLFTEGQNIYLRDKLTLVEHNLKEASYSFVSEAGIFNGRFEVIYTTQSLGVNNPILENSWLVYKNDTTFNILSKGFQMKDVVVYDTLGRVVYSAKDINADNHQFNSVGANQVLIVKVITTDNTELTKKVIN